jgi:hypothetical protein
MACCGGGVVAVGIVMALSWQCCGILVTVRTNQQPHVYTEIKMTPTTALSGDNRMVVWIVQHGIEEGWHWEINKQTKKNTMYMLVL